MQASTRQCLLALLLAGLVATLAGCAAPVDRTDDEPGLATAERVSRTLAGHYAGHSAAGEADSGSAPLVRLVARVERVGPAGVETSLSQRQGGGELRNFMLVLGPTAVATRLEGTFSPLDAQDRPIGTCPVEVMVRREGFVARTDPATCRFATGDGQVALIKEIAHDGQMLVIGDRVVDPETGETRMPDRVLQLQRVRDYDGWVGVRESEMVWRVDEAISVQSDGLGLDPEDVAGMPLGVTLDLAPYVVREGESPVLRLRVFDTASGELLGQSWADPLATRIGLALPDVQVGLRLSTRR